MFLSNKIGFPMFPTNLTSVFCALNISYKIWAVVDLPFVPVIVIFLFLLYLVKKTSKSVYIFLVFFFKNLLSLHFLISIPGLIMIKSIFFFLFFYNLKYLSLLLFFYS